MVAGRSWITPQSETGSVQKLSVGTVTGWKDRKMIHEEVRAWKTPACAPSRDDQRYRTGNEEHNEDKLMANVQFFLARARGRGPTAEGERQGTTCQPPRNLWRKLPNDQVVWQLGSQQRSFDGRNS